MTTVSSINGHKYANVRVLITDDDTVRLISYKTTVIEISPEGWLTVNGLYSKTTIKHIGWFMRERGMTYQFAKRLYTDNMKYNVYTGEIENL